MRILSWFSGRSDANRQPVAGHMPSAPVRREHGNLMGALKLLLRPITLLIVLGLTLIALIAVGTGALVLEFRNRALADSERELSNTALILAEQSDRAFQALELVQTGIIEQIASIGVVFPQHLDQHMSGRDTHYMLRDKVSGLPHVDAVTIINADGKLINFSRYWPIPKVNVSDRDYFKALKADPNLQSFISEPVRNRGTGTWTIYLARKIQGPDGQFLGLVLGAMRLNYFEKFFGAIVLGAAGSVSMLREDGLLLVRHPRIDGTVGKRFSGGVHTLGGSRSTVARLVGNMDQKDRLLALHRLEHYPIVIGVGNDVAAILQEWRKQALLLFGIAALVALVVMLFCLLVARQLQQGIRRSKQILQDQKLLLDTALNNMSQGLLMFDAEGRLRIANRRYIDMYGLPHDVDLTGRTIRELIHFRADCGSFTGDMEAYCAQIESDIACGKTKDHVALTSDGRWIRIVNQPMASGGWVATHEDITDKRKAEEERDQNREFLHQIVDNVPIAIIVKSAHDRRFALVNRAAEQVWGIPRSQVLGRTAHEVFPKARADLIAADDNRVAQSEAALFFKAHQNLSSADDNRILTSRKYAIRDSDGRPKYLVSVVEDVTERKRAEQERDQNQALLDLVVESIPTTIVVKDARDFRYVLINKAGESYFGIDREQMIGKTARDILPPASAEHLTKLDRQLLESGRQPVIDEHTLEMPGRGTRTALSKRLCLFDDKGEPKYLLAVVDDITERKQIAQQLQHAQRIEAIGSLTGGVAHDFNNLLMVMIGNLDILKEMIASDSPETKLIDTTLEAALQGAELTRRLLAFARRQPLQPDNVNVNALLEQTTQLLSRTLGENVKVELRLAGRTPMALVDKVQLEAAVVNIAINARDAMPNGGALTITTDLERAGAGSAIDPRILRPGDYVVIAISDTGTGMAPDVAARVFEPFFTTKAPGKGTGLGLSMVYGFIKQSKGYVTVDSAPGKGTTVRLYLPRATSAETRPPATLPAEHAVPKIDGARVILAVDDNPEVRVTAVGQLKALGYRVIEADGAQSALEKLDGGERIDLLFTDIVMPGGLNGRDLAKLARAKCPDLKVLYTSGFPGAESSDDVLLGMDAPFLAKPYRRQALAKAVAAALNAA